MIMFTPLFHHRYIEQRGCVLFVCKKKGTAQLVDPRALVLATEHASFPVDAPKWKDKGVLSSSRFIMRIAHLT